METDRLLITTDAVRGVEIVFPLSKTHCFTREGREVPERRGRDAAAPDVSAASVLC